ncbi:hypothetical protein HI914_02629 [Erysiphe necator]|nr:hypothetical protein HI914_02629 [Erysiphe necator]
MSFFRSKKPYTSVTVKIDSLTRHDRPESINDVSGVSDLIENITLQGTGPKEAGRAIRKKLKYGLPGTQLRALTILNELIEHGGDQFQKTFLDNNLINRLKLCATVPSSNYYVKRKCWSLFKLWTKFKFTEGLQKLALLSEVRSTIV